MPEDKINHAATTHDSTARAAAPDEGRRLDEGKTGWAIFVLQSSWTLTIILFGSCGPGTGPVGQELQLAGINMKRPGWPDPSSTPLHPQREDLQQRGSERKGAGKERP